MKHLIDLISEKLGKIIEAEDISKQITNDIINYILKKSYKFIYKNKEITIKIIVKYDSNIIVGSKDDVDYELNEATIKIHCPEDNINRSILLNVIEHEILHAVEDLTFHYEITTALTNANNILFGGQNSNTLEQGYDKNVAILIYLLDYHERHAYTSQLTNDIRKIVKDNNWTNNNFSYNDLVKELYNTMPWRTYFMFDKMIDLFNDNVKYLSSYNRITNTNSTNKEAITNLKRKYNKFRKKFEQLVPKITYEVLNLVR